MRETGRAPLTAGRREARTGMRAAWWLWGHQIAAAQEAQRLAWQAPAVAAAGGEIPQRSVIATALGRRVAVGAAASWPWAGYLALAAGAEMVAGRSVAAGTALHLVLIFALLIHSGFAPAAEAGLPLASTLGPLARVVALALPATTQSPGYWLSLDALPLLVAGLITARLLGLSRHGLSLRAGSLPLQIGIGLLGLPAGVIASGVLRPVSLSTDPSWPTIPVLLLVTLVSAGALDEFLFRGVLQAAAVARLGRWGIVFASALYAALQAGSRQPAQVAFAFAVGLGCGLAASRSRSLLGVALAHGLMNVTAFLILMFVGR